MPSDPLTVAPIGTVGWGPLVKATLLACGQTGGRRTHSLSHEPRKTIKSKSPQVGNSTGGMLNVTEFAYSVEALNDTFKRSGAIVEFDVAK